MLLLSKRTMVVAAVVVVIVVASLSFADTEDASPSSSSPYHMVEASDRQIAEMSSSQPPMRVEAEHDTPLNIVVERPPAISLTAAPQAQHSCYHNRVMFQPVVCSKAADIVSKAMELQEATNNPIQPWNIVHAGSRDTLLKLTELVEVFESSTEPAIAQVATSFLRTQRPQGFCGSCCECVAHGELKAFRVGYNATLVDMPLAVGTAGAADLPPDNHPFWSSQRHAVRLSPNSFDACPRSTLEQAVATISGIASRIDVLTLDAWKCDVPLLEQLVLGGMIRPRMVQFTTVADASYESLVKQLAATSYSCYFLTTKPENKRFRGIRQPVYPMAIRIDGCWRGVFDHFKHDRYHITCHDARDAELSIVLSSFTRMTHRGTFAGCSIPYRSTRLRRLTGV